MAGPDLLLPAPAQFQAPTESELLLTEFPPVPFQPGVREGNPDQRHRVSTRPSGVYKEEGFCTKCAAQLPFTCEARVFSSRVRDYWTPTH